MSETVDFDANGLAKQSNAVQKEVAAKKKARNTTPRLFMCSFWALQAKENADELVAKKKDLDAQVAAKRAEAKELEATMRQRASTVGNIVGKGVPVSLTEVRLIDFSTRRTAI